MVLSFQSLPPLQAALLQLMVFACQSGARRGVGTPRSGVTGGFWGLPRYLGISLLSTLSLRLAGPWGQGFGGSALFSCADSSVKPRSVRLPHTRNS